MPTRPSISWILFCDWPAQRAILSSSIIALMIALAPGAAFAVNFTPISVDASVTGLASGTSASYDMTESSSDLEPFLDIQYSIAGGNISLRSFVSGSNLLGNNPQRLLLSIGHLTRMVGPDDDTAMSAHYSMTFSLDGPTLASLTDTSSTFPIATATPQTPSSASLTYTLQESGGPIAFTYNAPTTNSAGTYASAIVPAGTYEFIVDAAASSPGDACCLVQSAKASGNTYLQFEDAPVTPLPFFGPFGSALMALAIAIGGGLAAKRGRSGPIA
jgi:hypothetical protein